MHTVTAPETSDLWWKNAVVYCLDVETFFDSAHDRGLRVIIDLVVNHTSNKHPWFKSARRSRTSPFRDYYVWSDEQRPPDGHLVFPGEEDEVWTWDE